MRQQGPRLRGDLTLALEGGCGAAGVFERGRDVDAGKGLGLRQLRLAKRLQFSAAASLGRRHRVTPRHHRGTDIAAAQKHHRLPGGRACLHRGAGFAPRQRQQGLGIGDAALHLAADEVVLGPQVEQLGLLFSVQAADGQRRRGALDRGLGLAGPGEIAHLGDELGARRRRRAIPRSRHQADSSRLICHRSLRCMRSIGCSVRSPVTPMLASRK